jgi:hypothetical protein
VIVVYPAVLALAAVIARRSPWVASRAPQGREASGFLVGVAGIAALLVALNA